MTKLKYFTAATVAELRDTVKARLGWYYRPQEAARDALSTAADGVRESRLEAENISERLVLPNSVQADDNGNPTGLADAVSALATYEALKDLTPQQAADERLWAYLCHVEYPQYVAGRWLGSRPSEDDDAARKVRNHFFAVGNRALIRDNGLSRLWWLGRIANQVEPGAPDEFLARLLHRQDVRSALIERPSVSMNRSVLSSINDVMREYWKRDRKLFEREPFRTWMIGLNRRGGVVLLDALPEEPLTRLLKEEAERALSAADAPDG